MTVRTDYFDILEGFRELVGTRNDYGARLRVNDRRDPWIVADSGDGYLVCMADVRREATPHVILYDTTYQLDRVHRIRHYETRRSIGTVEELEILPGYRVDSLERDYGLDCEWDGPWAPPQFYRRRVGEPKRIRKV